MLKRIVRWRCGRSAVMAAGAALLLAAGQARAADPGMQGVFAPAPPVADVPLLSGFGYDAKSPTYFHWAGIYAGGQFGYADLSGNFKRATTPLVAYQLRNLAVEAEAHPSSWEVLSRKDETGKTFGGFVGFNQQWDEVILGLELNYSRISVPTVVAPNNPIGRALGAGGNAYTVVLLANGNAKLDDLGELRLRAGYAMGNVMAYATAGLAVARGDFRTSVTIPLTENGAPYTFTGSSTRLNSFAYGFTLGAGVEYALISNIFLRGEYQFVELPRVQGIELQMHTVRAGVGLKF